MSKFAKRLRETRKKQHLTQEELAEEADISRVMITRYENAQVMPTVDVLISLSDALGVSIDYLLGRSEESRLITPINSKSIYSENRMPQSNEELKCFILDILKDTGLI